MYTVKFQPYLCTERNGFCCSAGPNHLQVLDVLDAFSQCTHQTNAPMVRIIVPHGREDSVGHRVDDVIYTDAESEVGKFQRIPWIV